MALSREFKKALKIYKLERKFGSLKHNRAHLILTLEKIFYEKCRQAFPHISHHSLWRLRDGSLGLIILEGEVRKMFLRHPIFREKEEMAILSAACMGAVNIAPVMSFPQIGSERIIPEKLEKLAPMPSEIIRKLRRIYKLYLDNKLYYAHPAQERKIPLSQLAAYLGKPEIEFWSFSAKNRSPPPLDTRYF